jgi:hypothetical protein
MPISATFSKKEKEKKRKKVFPPHPLYKKRKINKKKKIILSLSRDARAHVCVRVKRLGYLKKPRRKAKLI